MTITVQRNHLNSGGGRKFVWIVKIYSGMYYFVDMVSVH